MTLTTEVNGLSGETSEQENTVPMTEACPSESLAQSMSPALSFELLAECGRARRTRLCLPHGYVDTPVFMAVGTHGTVKGVTVEELEEIGYQIILGNTYHLSNRPGTHVLETFEGLHKFMQWKRNLLTDSGGFQMVSLLKLAEITEEGVEFSSPVDNTRQLLTPEMSMAIQNSIGADIMMALDDVVSATLPDKTRVAEATKRTTRWLDRCIAAHNNTAKQNLFGIVQGGLHVDLRLESLADLKARDLPGYAIGGLSGGEEKEDFWRIVELCTRPLDNVGLPREKPRYLMGVGYPLDIVVSVALGVDMVDCVYPTRTARFGTALVPEGTLRIKLKKYATDMRPLQENCRCVACTHYTRAFLHGSMAKAALGIRLLTLHNLTYMYDLGASMRKAIEENAFSEFVVQFLQHQFHSGLKTKYTKCSACRSVDVREKGCPEEVAPRPPLWVRDALETAGILLSDIYTWAETAHNKDAQDGSVRYPKRSAVPTSDTLAEAAIKRSKTEKLCE